MISRVICLRRLWRNEEYRCPFRVFLRARANDYRVDFSESVEESKIAQDWFAINALQA